MHVHVHVRACVHECGGYGERAYMCVCMYVEFLLLFSFTIYLFTFGEEESRFG